MKKFLTKTNHVTRKGLGVVGRPVAAGAAGGAACYGAGYALENETLQHPGAVLAAAVLAAGGTEVILRVFGNEADVNSAEVGKQAKAMIDNFADIDDTKERNKAINAFCDELPKDIRAGVREGLKAGVKEKRRQDKDDEEKEEEAA